MTYHVFSLAELTDILSSSDLETLISTFQSLPSSTSTPHSVEVFLRDNAIEFEKSGFTSTYFVFSDHYDLLGFFALANRPLIFLEGDFQALSNTKRKQLERHGVGLDNGGHLVNAYLLGQLGKNYALTSNSLTGQELLTLAYNKAKEAAKIINTRFLWLECENVPNLLNFYKRFGFSLIDAFNSSDGFKVMIIKIQR